MNIEQRTVMLHGHRLAYRIGGRSRVPAGRCCCCSTASPAARGRGAGAARAGFTYTVIAPDLLGHGDSDKPRHDYSLGAYANLLRDLMFALGIERATIVGHSLGGGIGMQLAYQHPMCCERLVLVSSGGLGREVSWMLRALSLPGSST